MIDIRNCKLAYRCNQRWEQLEPVPGAAMMRFCARCQNAVHLVDSEEAFVEMAKQGKCVAVLHVDYPAAMVGVPAVPVDGRKLRIVR